MKLLRFAAVAALGSVLTLPFAAADDPVVLGEKGWEGGFGRVVLGEKWVNHHGAHGKEGTRGIVAPGQEKHPILRGIKSGDVFGTTDVYTAAPPAGSTILVLGEVTETLQPDSK